MDKQNGTHWRLERVNACLERDDAGHDGGGDPSPQLAASCADYLKQAVGKCDATSTCKHDALLHGYIGVVRPAAELSEPCMRCFSE